MSRGAKWYDFLSLTKLHIEIPQHIFAIVSPGECVRQHFNNLSNRLENVSSLSTEEHLSPTSLLKLRGSGFCDQRGKVCVYDE